MNIFLANPLLCKGAASAEGLLPLALLDLPCIEPPDQIIQMARQQAIGEGQPTDNFLTIDTAPAFDSIDVVRHLTLMDA